MCFMVLRVRMYMLAVAMVAVVAAQVVLAQQSLNYTGNGGKGISLTICVPQAIGLDMNLKYIPVMVQGGFVSTFSGYSAIDVLDWGSLDELLVNIANDVYDENADALKNIGHFTHTSHYLTGKITKTATGYHLQINITRTSDKMTTASYSGTYSFAELDNLTGVRRASFELLQKVGVELTDKARQELAGAAEANQISAQTALAKGVTAQRAGTEFKALNYYNQAANFNPTLKEAVERSTIMTANISSGNIGIDLRNDIVWRKSWVERLKETEESVSEMIKMIMANAVAPPFTLTYSEEFKEGNVNYQRETEDLSITANMNADRTWFTAMDQTLDAANRATKAVLDGLNATNRKKEWGLARWPREGVSNTTPFISDSERKYDVTAVFELVDRQSRVISSQTVKLNPSFRIKPDANGRFTVVIMGDNKVTVTFKDVRADDISDDLTIRVVPVRYEVPPTVRASIVVEKTLPLTDTRDGRRYNTVRIGGKRWMAENISYQPKSGKSWCYDRDNSNCNKYGRLYDWRTAKTVCPMGWHLPSKQEWESLIKAAGGWSNGGKVLKAGYGWIKNGNGTDDYGFTARPGGLRFEGIVGDFIGSGETGGWWSATEDTKYVGDHVQGLMMEYNQNKIKGMLFEKTKGISVRCVEN